MLEILGFDIFHTESLTLDQIESLVLFNRKKKQNPEKCKRKCALQPTELPESTTLP